MVYMLELHGKGSDKADEIIFRVFNNALEAHLYSSEFTRLEDIYWI